LSYFPPAIQRPGVETRPVLNFGSSPVTERQEGEAREMKVMKEKLG
jgi:hypothetical protein